MNGADKDPMAVALGRRGGLKGGRARAKNLSSDELHRAAQYAANVRWSLPRLMPPRSVATCERAIQQIELLVEMRTDEQLDYDAGYREPPDPKYPDAPLYPQPFGNDEREFWASMIALLKAIRARLTVDA